jgi:hypothetical protein
MLRREMRKGKDARMNKKERMKNGNQGGIIQ